MWFFRGMLKKAMAPVQRRGLRGEPASIGAKTGAKAEGGLHTEKRPSGGRFPCHCDVRDVALSVTGG